MQCRCSLHKRCVVGSSSRISFSKIGSKTAYQLAPPVTTETEALCIGYDLLGMLCIWIDIKNE